MLNPYRRHLPKCPHKAKGQNYIKCSCPIWCDGELHGRRFRKSLGTRDWARAAKRIAKLEEPGGRLPKPIVEAVEAFHDSVQGHAVATRKKYTRILGYLRNVATSRGLRNVDEVTVEDLDAYRAYRGEIAGLTWLKEIEILRQFFQFCIVRKWTDDNPARGVEKPRNLRPSEVVPYSREEIVKILAACDVIGRTSYERLRARAIVLLLRYTALRISDIALLAKDRVRNGEIDVRTMKSGEWVRLPVHPELQSALAALPAPRGCTESRYFFWSGNGGADSMVRAAERTLSAVFAKSEVKGAHAHRFRHTLATELLEHGHTYEDVADVLGNSAAIVRKHYAKWSKGRQKRLTDMMNSVFLVQNWYTIESPHSKPLN